MRRLPAYLLSVLFVLMGTGTLKFLHNLAHVQLPAVATQECLQAPLSEPSKPAPSPFEHERDCPLHMMLGSPLLDQAGDSAIVWESVSQWVLPPAQSEPDGARLPARVDCRGPPAC